MNAANAIIRPLARMCVFAVLALCTLVRAQSVAWTSLQVGPRNLHAMAYDSARGVTVLFGGAGGVFNGETWEWNGTAWSRRVVSSPSPRDGHAMAYDSARHVTVLFGGYTGGGPIGYNA